MKKLFTSLFILALSIACLAQLRQNPWSHIDIQNGQKQDILANYINSRKIPAHLISNQDQMKLKSSQIIKQRLDSTISETKEDLEDWMLEGKDIFNYNEDDFCTEYISYGYNNSSGFYLTTKFEFVSEDNTKLSLVALYVWENNEWEKDNKYEYEYYNNGLLKQYITFKWDKDSESWITLQKAGMMYNEKGQLFIETYSEFDTETKVWTDYMKMENTFNSEWINTERLTSVYDEDLKQWFALEKTKFSYKPIGFLDSIVSYRWNFDKKIWDKNSKEENIYDSHNNLSSALMLNWDEDNNEWVNDWKNDYVYNNAYTIDEILFPVFFLINNPLGFAHMQIENINSEWDKDEEKWLELDKNTSYYSSVNISPVQQIPKNDLKIYPNPTQGQIRVLNGELGLKDVHVEIYDLNCRKVFEKHIFPTGAEAIDINVRRLESGVYFLCLISEKFSVCKKIVVHK